MSAAEPLTLSPGRLTHLDRLEAESIHIIREVAAEFERPVMLFSGGKDSIVMLRIAEKAFYPAAIPFPLMHVDTGHNFPEVMDYRDRRVAELGARLHQQRAHPMRRGARREREAGSRRGNELASVHWRIVWPRMVVGNHQRLRA